VYSKEVIEEAIKLYQDGFSLKTISKKTGVNQQSLYYHTRKLNIKKGARLPTEKVLKKYEMYCRGFPMTQIAEEFGVTRQAISLIFRKHGFKQPEHHVNKDTINKVQMHLDGKTPEQIADSYGCSINCVYIAIGRYYTGRALVPTAASRTEEVL
jgi:hypothetical protein